MLYETFLLEMYKKNIFAQKNMLKCNIFIVYNDSEKNANVVKKEVFI